MSGRPARPPRERPLRERPLREADLAACATVFYEASDELYARNAQPALPRDPDAMARFFRYLAFAEGGAGWVAEGPDGSVVAFGIAVEREATWFLSFLFVAPGAQALGVGRALLERLLPAPGSPAAADDALWHTCVDSLQPISTGLYASYGLVPRMPILTLVGRPPRDALPALPAQVEASAFAAVPLQTAHLALPAADPATLPLDLLAELDAVDRGALGWRRRGDHCRFLADGRLLVRYRAADGAPLGYGYVHSSGRLGPVAVRDPALLPPILGDLVARLEPPGAWRVYVPGEASTALVPLLAAGLRFDGSPGLWAANRQGPTWDRYLPAGFALP